MSLKLETSVIRTIATFEKITNVHARDCLVTDEQISFLVDPEKIGIAVGKGGSTIKEMRRIFGKQVKIFGYYEDSGDLMKSIVPSLKSIETNNGSMIVTVPAEDRVSLIGKNGNNIKAIKNILERHYNIKNLRVR